ncbi:MULTISPECIES: alpha/beta hydrolase [unclassified Spiroplasma]|uniref:alpha/beta hydrolase n=1 Tax=unclassified Spiroplasma TaxID=2637901 RepID=UPI00279AA1DC|nr:MAG: alpha/beta fold hydrolase [Spiroplasma endosymbiont of Drosophila atripex]
MKQSSINRIKLRQKVNINSIEMFKACLQYNSQSQPKVKIELAKWPMYFEYWEYLEKHENIIPFSIKTSIDNLTLYGNLLKSPLKNENNNKTIILLHGITNTRFWIFKQAFIFLRAGYNVIWYDARNHGESDASPTTFGLKESQDLQDIIEYCCKTYKQETTALGLYGFSLGGATVVMWSDLYAKHKINQKVKFIISDCTFSRLDRTYSEKLYNYAFLPTNLMLKLSRKKAQKTFGVDGLQEIQPIKYLKLIPDMPMLFLHGQNDHFINYTNANELFQEKIRYEIPKKSSLYTILDANHGQSFLIGDLDHTVVNEYNLVTDKGISDTTLEFVQKWINT